MDGRHGLVQWQCTVPGGHERTLAEVLGRLHGTGVEPVMTVLKWFGDGNDGPLSFPARGWSLAVDLPADPELAPVLDGLDRLVADHGGRIYLAKDARLDPGLVRAMYPASTMAGGARTGSTRPARCSRTSAAGWGCTR